MAASSSQADQHDTGPTWQRQETKNWKGHLHRHLNMEVPVVASTGCFRPSPTSSRSSSPSGNAYADRPASPSLIRSPSAWMGARGHSFASSARHTRRRSGDFHYDARNFDEGTDGEASGDEAGIAAGDTLKNRCSSSRLPASPPRALLPSVAPACGGGNGAKDNVPAREKGRDLD